MKTTVDTSTRLPAPHRMTPLVVSKYLSLSYGKHPIVALSPPKHRDLIVQCAADGVSGGAVYDALIAATCAQEGLRLLTLDGRARQTYSALGVEHELLA